MPTNQVTQSLSESNFGFNGSFTAQTTFAEGDGLAFQFEVTKQSSLETIGAEGSITIRPDFNRFNSELSSRLQNVRLPDISFDEVSNRVKRELGIPAFIDLVKSPDSSSIESTLRDEVNTNRISGRSVNYDIRPSSDRETATETVRFNFDRIDVPQRVNIGSLPSITVTFVVTFDQSGGFFGFGRRAVNEITVQDEIPPEAFFESVNISVNCSSLYSSINSDLSDLEEDVTNLKSNIEERRDKLQSFANSIRSGNIGSLEGVGSITEARDNFKSIKQEVEDASADEVSGLSLQEQRFGGVPNPEFQIRDRIEDIAVRDCRSELRSRLDDISSDITNFNRIKREALNIEIGDISLPLECIDKNRQVLSELNLIVEITGAGSKVREGEVGTANGLSEVRLSRSDLTPPLEEDPDTLVRDIRDGIEDPISATGCLQELGINSTLNSIERRINNLADREPGIGVTCSEANAALSSRADNITSQLRSISNRNPSDVRIKKAEDTINAARDSTLPQLREETEKEGSPCSGKLTNLRAAISDAESTVRRARETQEESMPPEERAREALPCDEKFPNIQNEINNLREEVNSIDPPASADDVQRIAQQGDRLADMIDNVAGSDPRCQQLFADRTSDLVNRVESLRESVRIIRPEDGEQEDETDELTQNLISTLEEIQFQAGQGEEGQAGQGGEGELPEDIDVPQT